MYLLMMQNWTRQDPNSCRDQSSMWYGISEQLMLYSLMMFMKFADLSQSDRSNWVM